MGAFDRCLISLSLLPIFLLLPINDLHVSDHIENIIPVSSFWSRTEFRVAIKMIIELLTSVPMPLNQETSISKVNYLPRTLKDRRYGVIHAHRASRPSFDLS
jgi:hypothetical protein